MPEQSGASVTDLRTWLRVRRRFDDLRRLRPWKVDLHDAKVGERRDRPGQLTIERNWPDA